MFSCLGYVLMRTFHLGLGHVESTYHMSTGRWSDPVFVNDPYLRVHGLAPGLQYGKHQCSHLVRIELHIIDPVDP